MKPTGVKNITNVVYNNIHNSELQPMNNRIYATEYEVNHSLNNAQYEVYEL